MAEHDDIDSDADTLTGLESWANIAASSTVDDNGGMQRSRSEVLTNSPGASISAGSLGIAQAECLVTSTPSQDLQHNLTLAASAASVAEQPQPVTPPAAFCDLWLNHILHPLAAIRDGLGQTRRRATVMTIFSGAQPEQLFPRLFNIECDFLLSVDRKEAAYRFCRDNGFNTRHHFLHAEEVCKSGRGICANHDFGVCCAAPDEYVDATEFMQPDLLLAGLPCPPYSRAREQRFKGTVSHKEAHTISCFEDALALWKPKKAILEEVQGFMCRESSADPESPYLKMVKRINKRMPQLTIRCYMLQGKTWLRFHRRRVYIVFTDSRQCGEESAEYPTKLIQDCSHPR